MGCCCAKRGSAEEEPQEEPRLAAMMLFPSSGRCGFDPLPLEGPLANVPPVETMVKILKRENELRRSDEVQISLDSCSGNVNGVYLELQRRVAREFGYGDCEDDCVKAIRCAPLVYPDEPAMSALPLYRKFNRSRDGPLQVGDPAPDVVLCSLADLSPVKLSDFATDKPLIVVAGSGT